MASALGLHVGLDSSALPSCSLFRPASFQHGAVKAGGRSRTVKCSCSREEESGIRRKAFSTLVATGLALAISTNSAIAVPSPPGSDKEIVKTQADSLLKEADKLMNKVPGVKVPTYEGVPDEDAGRISRKAGSGIVEDLQDAGSKLVGEARETSKQTGDEYRQNFDETLAKTENKTNDVKKGLQGLFGQAKDKVTGGVEQLKGGPGDLVGDARNKVGSEIDTAKNTVGSNMSNMGNMDNGLKDPVGKAKELVSDAKSKAGSAADNAKSSLGGAVENAKSMVGSNMNNMDNGMKNPFGKAKELVSDTRNKGVENAKSMVGSNMNNMGNKGGKVGTPAENAKSKGLRIQ